MVVRALTHGAGVLGGLLWVLRLVLDLAGALGDTASDALLWTGAALLAVAVLELGLGLVGRAPVWLRAVVAVGAVALATSVVAVLHGDGDGVVVDGVLGLVAIAVSVRLLVRRRRERAATAAPGRRGGQRRSVGSHAR